MKIAAGTFAFLFPLAAFAQAVPCQYEAWPVALGAEWETRSVTKSTDFEGKPNETVLTYKEKVVEVEEANFAVELEMEAVPSTRIRYRCSAEGPMATQVGDVAMGDDTGSHYPTSLKVGNSWAVTQRAAGSVITTTYRITRKEKVSVPAGTFEAYRADYTREVKTEAGDSPNTDSGATWFAANVGIVKAVSKMSFAHPDLPKPMTSETKSELLSYKPAAKKE